MTAPTSTTGGFVHLHVHTEYSGLDGMTRIGDAARKVAADGQPALAVTDHGTLGGAWQLNREAKAAGIKPLIGVEAYLAVMTDWRDEPDRTQKQNVEVDRDDESAVDDDVSERGGAQKSSKKLKKYEHLTLFATSPTGWKNLASMMDIAEESGFHAKPRIDYKLLKEYSEGILVLTGCLGGPILGPISRGHVEQADRNMERIIDAVGRDNVFVEIMEHGIPSESNAIPAMVEFAAKWNLPLVATNDSHYTDAEDHEVHEAWLAVQSGKSLTDPKRFQFHGRGYHIRTEAEMRAMRPEPWWQVACDNTVAVAARFEDNVLPTPRLHLPKFPIPDGYKDANQYIVHLAKEGSKKRFGDEMPQAVKERLNIELKIIRDQGFIDYFLIVHDLIKWAREDGNLPDWPTIPNGILVGPGRGSAAGSVLSYVLEIVDIDPLENNLLFERFMEPGRKDMPDIDIDFEQRYVDRVRAYLAHKWGRDKVARIGTHNVAQTKAAIKDAARVLELPDVAVKLTKVVPLGANFKDLDDPLNGATEKYRSVLLELGEPGQKVVTLAKKMFGILKGEGIHACGIIVADEPLRGLIPLRRDRSKSSSGGLTMITAWDAPDIGDISGDKPGVGLLKLDVLSIRNLDIVSQAIEFIEETTEEALDSRLLPHPDTKGNDRVQKTWGLLKAGRTAGVFQMESDGMKNVARSIGPESLTDLSAIVALFRPGPLSANMDKLYADRKAKVIAVDYDQFTFDKAEQDVIASVLGETYGVWVFQEQLMRLGAAVAGFDAGKRSKLRKAVGKKDKVVMDQASKMFFDGAQLGHHDDGTPKQVFARETAEKLIEAMKGSASYLFNASHSAAYAQLAYITAYLKANWPAQYGAAILATTHDKDKRLAAMDAIRGEGIDILPPDINKSRKITAPEGNAVRLGLSEVSGVGQLGDDVVELRERTGVPFTSLGNLITRLYNVAEKKAPSIAGIEGLIEAGAMDEFGPRLGQLMVVRALRSAPTLPTPDEEFGVLEKSMRQRKRLGVAIGEHPLRSLGNEVRSWVLPHAEELEDRFGRVKTIPRGSKAIPIAKIPDQHNAEVLVAGLLAEWGESSYSKGQKANITLESSTGRISGVMWDDALKGVSQTPDVGSVVAAYASVTMRERDIEDEDGNWVETLVTKELTFRRIFPIEVDNRAVGSLMAQLYSADVATTLPPVPALTLLKVANGRTATGKTTTKPPAVGPKGQPLNNSRPAPAPEKVETAAPAVQELDDAPQAFMDEIPSYVELTPPPEEYGYDDPYNDYPAEPVDYADRYADYVPDTGSGDGWEGDEPVAEVTAPVTAPAADPTSADHDALAAMFRDNGRTRAPASNPNATPKTETTIKAGLLGSMTF